MGFNSAFKGLKLLKKNPGNGRFNNLNDPVLSVLRPTQWFLAFVYAKTFVLLSTCPTCYIIHKRC